MIFDTHAHYDDKRYNSDCDELMKEMAENGVSGIINCGTDYMSSLKSIKLAEKYPNIYAAVGVYPHETVKAGDFDKDKWAALCANKKVVAIGEIGLDYHYDTAPKSIQLDWAEKQISLAKDFNLPVSFHNREAHADTLTLLKRTRPKGVLHCFSGSPEMAEELVKLDIHIGFGGVVTFKNARVAKEVVKRIPLKYLLLETDAPYISPEPFRGKRNRSDYLQYVAREVALIRGISENEVLQITCENAEKLFLMRN